jgi:hypothetical protein
MRNYLVGTAPFPQYIYLRLILCAGLLAQGAAQEPLTSLKQGFRVHELTMRGLLFYLAVGRSVPSEFKQVGLGEQGDRFLIVDDHDETIIRRYSAMKRQHSSTT